MFFQGVKISQRDSVTWSINFYCLAAMQLYRVETRLSYYLKSLGFSHWLVMLLRIVPYLFHLMVLDWKREFPRSLTIQKSNTRKRN